MENEQNVLRLDICWKKGVEPQTFVREEPSAPEPGDGKRPEPKVELSMEEVSRVANLIEEIKAKLDDVLKNVHIVEPNDDELPF